MKKVLIFLLIAILSVSFVLFSACVTEKDSSQQQTPTQTEEDSDPSGEDPSGEDPSGDNQPSIEERKIMYELNGGINHNKNPQKFIVGSSVILFEPTRVGFKFDGWYLNEDFSGEVIFEITTEFETDVILYAKWTKINAELPIKPII